MECQSRHILAQNHTHSPLWSHLLAESQKLSIFEIASKSYSDSAPASQLARELCLGSCSQCRRNRQVLPQLNWFWRDPLYAHRHTLLCPNRSTVRLPPVALNNPTPLILQSMRTHSQSTDQFHHSTTYMWDSQSLGGERLANRKRLENSFANLHANFPPYRHDPHDKHIRHKHFSNGEQCKY